MNLNILRKSMENTLQEYTHNCVDSNGIIKNFNFDNYRYHIRENLIETFKVIRDYSINDYYKFKKKESELLNFKTKFPQFGDIVDEVYNKLIIEMSDSMLEKMNYILGPEKLNNFNEIKNIDNIEDEQRKNKIVYILSQKLEKGFNYELNYAHSYKTLKNLNEICIQMISSNTNKLLCKTLYKIRDNISYKIRDYYKNNGFEYQISNTININDINHVLKCLKCNKSKLPVE